MTGHDLDADGACTTCDTKAGVTDPRLPAESSPLTDTGSMSLGPQTYTPTLVTVTAMQYQPDDFADLRNWVGPERLYAPIPEKNVPARVWASVGDAPAVWVPVNAGDWIIHDGPDWCVQSDETFRRRYRRVVQTEMTVDVVVVEPGDEARK